MKTALLPFALLLLLQAAEPPSGSQAIRGFYAAYQALKISGLPQGAGLAKLSPHLSSSLKTLLRASRKSQAACEKSHPGDKPPWVEGDMFSGNFEGFTRVKNVPDTGVARGERVGFLVDFEYAQAKGGQATVAWRDEVVLVKESGRWVIDDVLYRRDAPFGNGFGSSLRQSLAGPGCP